MNQRRDARRRNMAHPYNRKFSDYNPTHDFIMGAVTVALCFLITAIAVMMLNLGIR